MRLQCGKLGYLACFGLALVAVPFVFSQLNQSATPALATTPTSAQPVPTVLPAPAADTVYVTRAGTKYHRQNCRWAKDSLPVPLAQAAEKYRPCSVCVPPTLPAAKPVLASTDVPFTPPAVPLLPAAPAAESAPPAPRPVVAEVAAPAMPIPTATPALPVVSAAAPAAPEPSPVVTAPAPAVSPPAPFLPPVLVHEGPPAPLAPRTVTPPAPIVAAPAAKPATSCPCSGAGHSYTYSRGLFRRR